MWSNFKEVNAKKCTASWSDGGGFLTLLVVGSNGSYEKGFF